MISRILQASHHLPRAAATAARPPVPPTTHPWSRLTRAERGAVVRAAVAAGSSVGAVAHERNVALGSHAYRLLMRMWDTHRERASQPREHECDSETTAPPPGPGVLIGSLREGVCHWPLWPTGPATPGPETALYCGAPAAPGRPYCPICSGRARKRREISPRGEDFSLHRPEDRLQSGHRQETDT